MNHKIPFENLVRLFLVSWAIIGFLTGHTFAEDNSVYVSSKTLKDQFQIIISISKAISDYKHFVISDDIPSKLVIDISGQWKNKGKSSLQIDNEIVNSVRIGEHPDYLRIVADLKIKYPSSFYNIQRISDGIIVNFRMKQIEKQSVKSDISEQALKLENKLTRVKEIKDKLTEKIDSVSQNINDSPSNIEAYYRDGEDLFQKKQYEDAIKKFEYVRDHAMSELLRSRAAMWIEAIEKKQKSLKPYSLFTKIGYKYDSYVNNLFEKRDDNSFIDIVKKSDYAAVGYFSGKYSFIKDEDKEIGIGYDHYQTWHDKFRQYDLVQSTIDLYFKYHLAPNVLLGISYLPSYYWMDSKEYLVSYLFKIQLSSQIGENININFIYNHSDNNYIQDVMNETEYIKYLNDDSFYNLNLNTNLDGRINEILMNIAYKFGKRGYVYSGLSYEDNSESKFYDTSSLIYPDLSYELLKMRLGVLFYIPYQFKLALNGEVSGKKYNNYYTIMTERKDIQYYGHICLSHKFLYDWLYIGADYDYTINKSNYRAVLVSNNSEFFPFDYERYSVALSLTAEY